MESSKIAKNARLGLCALACVLASAGAHAQVFKCTDDSGKVNYTDRPCADSQKAETVTIEPPPIDPEDAKEKAADNQREFQRIRAERKRAEREEIDRRIAESEAKIIKMKADNYDPEKCRVARSRMAAIKIREPISYSYNLTYVELQSLANLVCGD